MREFLSQKIYKELSIAEAVIIVLLLALIGFGAYYYWGLNIQTNNLQQKITEQESALKLSEESLTNALNDNKQLAEALYSEQQKNNQFEAQVKEIAGQVGVLTKLSQTDPELLKKYSKVYFLNENYVPDDLLDVAEEYTYDTGKTYLIHGKVKPFLEEMIAAAATDGVDLKVISAYRSFSTQAILKYGYSVTYGSGSANKFSADQGYSEHQLGTTVDFTTPEMGGSLTTAFEKTTAYAWLQKNAHRYGFALSYPKENTFYQYEPWHWRFVGTELARRLNYQDKYFYDIDQQEIDEYLVKLFD